MLLILKKARPFFIKDIQSVWSVQDLKYMQNLVHAVRMDDKLIQYITQMFNK